MESDRAIKAFRMKPDEIGFEQVYHYVKRHFDNYDELEVIVVQCPDEIDVDIDPVAWLFFVNGDEETDNGNVWRQWWIVQLWLPTSVSRIMIEYS